jgi:uncharacterized membrane protein YfcA
MSAGPLNRVTGALGLLALVPTAIMSAMGHLTAGDTAVRAGVTLALVIAVRKVVGFYLTITASALERQVASDDADAESDGDPDGPRRRQADLGAVPG